ncbi:hypothetical protein HPB47_020602 [Ixodes persulcatus]|uniref:Uncharacterized protein n=1 Tax=Ixodes persulcatus TaxID=34615 RepID=A0AC60QH52_IXOPE|nr:hypothetical protein HPB47_020602 [Ixodes persulcatus]
MSRQWQLSSRPKKKKKRDDIHPKDSSTSSGCETKGSSRDADETRLEEGNPSQSHLETSLPSQNDIGHSSRCKRHKKRLRGVSDFQSGPDSFNRQHHKGLKRSNSRKRKPSSGLGDGNREDIHPKKASTDSGWKSKEHSSDTREPKLNKQGGPRQRRWVFHSGPNASDEHRDWRLSAHNSRNQDTHSKELSVYSGNAGHRLEGTPVNPCWMKRL